jgi:hypothetical protein
VGSGAPKSDTLRYGSGAVGQEIGSAVIDDHEAEQSGTGAQRRATGDPGTPVSGADLPPYDDQPLQDAGMHPDDLWASDDAPLLAAATPPDEPPLASQLERADDLGLGEAELALLQWALRQRQGVQGQPPQPSAPAGARPEPGSAPPPEHRGAGTPPPVAGTPAEELRSPWELLHASAEEAISALVAAGGPDPRDFASPRLTRRAKTVIAIALVVLFLVSALGGFVGYRVTHRAAGPAGQAAGPLVEVRGGAV